MKITTLENGQRVLIVNGWKMTVDPNECQTFGESMHRIYEFLLVVNAVKLPATLPKVKEIL